MTLLPGLPARLRRLLIRDEAVDHQAAGDGAGVPVIVQQDFPVYYRGNIPDDFCFRGGSRRRSYVTDRTSPSTVAALLSPRRTLSVGEYTFTHRAASAKAPNARQLEGQHPRRLLQHRRGGRAGAQRVALSVGEYGTQAREVRYAGVLRSSAPRRRIRHCLSRART